MLAAVYREDFAFRGVRTPAASATEAKGGCNGLASSESREKVSNKITPHMLSEEKGSAF